MRIGGSFHVHNVDGFARLLQAGIGLDVRLLKATIEVAKANSSVPRDRWYL